MTDKKDCMRSYRTAPTSDGAWILAEKYGAVFEYNDFMLPGYLDDRAGMQTQADLL